MARSNADLLQLKAELTNDPLGLGLTTVPADDEANANILNEVRAICAIDREAIPVSEIAACMDRAEFNAASAADRQWIGLVTAGGSVNPKTGGKIRAGLLQIFANGTATRTALLAIVTEPANRIDHLFKAGTLEVGGTVTPSDVAAARQA